MHIGKTITIRDAKNKSLVGKTGRVLDETKHTITIQTPTNQLTIIKDQIITLGIEDSRVPETPFPRTIEEKP